MANKIEALHRAVRQDAALNALIALESILSYPVPYKQGGQVYLRFLVFNTGRLDIEGKRTPIYRPHARVSVEYDTGKLVEYVDLRFEEGIPMAQPKEVVGVYPHEQMAGLSFEAAKAIRTALFFQTEQVIPLYGRAELAAEEARQALGYIEIFERVTEPCLRSDYEKLSPEFFSWLDNVQHHALS